LTGGVYYPLCIWVSRRDRQSWGHGFESCSGNWIKKTKIVLRK